VSKWTNGTAGELHVYPPHQNTPALRWEARTWRAYALALIFPRSVPEYIDDETVSIQLRECEQAEPLPWSIPDECLYWSDDHDERTSADFQ
jgi:hypothetical protein